MTILGPGSCPVPRPTPRAFLVPISSLSSVSTLRSHSTLASGPSSMPTSGSVFCTRFYSGYGLQSSSQFIVKSVQITLQACSSIHDFTVSIPQSLPHTLAEGLNPFHSQRHLWHQWRMSAFAAFPEVKRGSPGLLFSFSLPHRRGTLVLYSRDKHYGTHPSVPFGCVVPYQV